jgi:hypothetical protein
MAKVIFITLTIFMIFTTQPTLAEQDINKSSVTVNLFLESQKRTLQGIIAGRRQITESCMKPSLGLSPSDELNKLKTIIEEEKEFFLIQNSSNAKKLLLLSNKAKELETKNCNVFQSLMENKNSASECGASKKISNLVNEITISLDIWNETRLSVFDELFKISLLETNQCVSKNFTKTLKMKYDSFNTQLDNEQESFYASAIEQLDLIFKSEVQ